MRVSYRQARRIFKRYRSEKDVGLQHRNRGKIPNNAYSNDFKAEILGLYKQKYMGFGPTFACEKLLEDDGHTVCPETLRLWLKKAELWTKQRKRKPYRKLRDRRPNFGDLLQIDG